MGSGEQGGRLPPEPPELTAASGEWWCVKTRTFCLLGTLTHSQALAVDLVAPASVVPQGFDAAVQVDEEGLQEGLPRVQRLHRL